MNDERRADEPKTGAELGGEARRVIAHGRQAAASFRARGAEGCHENVTTRTYSATKRRDVTLSILTVNQKVEDGPVMPHGVLPPGLEGGYVLMQQSDRRSGRAQASAQLLEH